MGRLHLLILVSTFALMSLSQTYALVPAVASAFGCPRGRIVTSATQRANRGRLAPLSSLPRQLPRQIPTPALIGEQSGRSSRPCQSTQLSLSTSASSSWQPAMAVLERRPGRSCPARLSSSSSRASDGDDSDEVDDSDHAAFKAGDKIQVEVLSFGPLGASVGIVARSHDPDDVLPEADDFLGRGLILQKEIQYYRQSRDGVDVVRGEILPAYAERVRETGNVDVSLRAYGGKAKAVEMAVRIMDRLASSHDGLVPVGDKSSPEEIQNEFPGASKASFKRAVSTLYKEGKVQPGPYSIQLMKLSNDEAVLSSNKADEQ